MSKHQKNFDDWNEQKKNIQQNVQEIYFDTREVWWCTLGVNIGHEQDGVGTLAQRPVLVLRKLSAETCVVLPMTTSKQNHPFRIFVGTIHGRESYAILSQIRVVDTKRFMKKVSTVENGRFEEIRNAARDML